MQTFFKKNWVYVASVSLFLLDWILLNLAFLFALWLKFGNLYLFDNYTRPFVFMNALFPFFAIGIGMYRSLHNINLEYQRSYFKKLVFYLGIVTLSFLFTIKGYYYSRQVMISTFIVYFFFLEIAHSGFKKIQTSLVKKGKIGYRCLIVGVDESAYKFTRNLVRAFGEFYNIIGFIKNFKGKKYKVHPELNAYIVGEKEDFEKILMEQRPDLVFIVSDSMRVEKYKHIHDMCEKYNIKLKMVSPYVRYILANSKIRDVSGVSLVQESWRVKHKKINDFLKRVFDLIVTFAASVVLLPLGIVIASIIKLTSKGPVFFKQKRALYKGGPEFYFYKFRTMYENADQLKEKLLQHNESNGALFKMKNDPRVTPIGRFLRKYSLDEIPQFINVLKGEMSIIGPRPLPVKDFDHIQNGKMNYDWYKKRGEAKPGISGLWQVSGRSNLSFEEMLFLDLYYVENQSIFFDLEIIFETIPVVLFGKGAY
jgi:exopolysaccharide biosynthesis polyprenyl glycosylphosphotransferase